MKRGDLILIGVIVIAALAFLVPKWLFQQESENLHNSKVFANITVDGELYQKVELTEEEQIIKVETSKGINILKVHDYGIEMFDADCPDKVCLSFGFVTRPNSTIVCIPHRVLVELVSEDGAGEDELDAVVQ
ncbi:NusG domain II-containing protein [Paenibacillus thiaminolyticus]|uniref:NusG domain II-containing protein n=1 Tax=Paenibacillus thiaminolyticus TaxID=49283 RepID=A0AAP9DVI1_PANTH|nr:NusG domain II-containing protein [Paenibacillus thiaminolyticus]MCY9534693.1 NusG domain II-containing protein [Paenibacillus thiaminolyticus]MCY9602026.1 NusG domain II-containing protein [Paenibacillus thiaminolyticus]MCY9608916.1 NusG domain II-containing protein [Paenibacillus thiaminolyticus]MCY9614970.1 NusG domain II-containing protein [Paenibacillus thiaminolyticus]MCY9618512.1 NusG domain II-containing protein [Paenibacillus thiaminolyticus]